MKIAIIHLNLAAESGDPRVVFSLSRAFINIGHSVSIYTAQFEPKYFPELHKGLDIREVSLPARLTVASTKKGIWEFIKERLSQKRAQAEAVRRIAAALEPDFDIIDCHNDYSYQISSSYRKRNPKAKIIYTMHNPPYYHAPKPNPLLNLLSILNAALERLKLNKFLPAIDMLITLDEERKKMADPLGLPVHILRIPVDFESFKAPVKRIKKGKKDVVLLSVGSLSPARKFEDTILAASILRKRGYAARVILICRDFWNEKAYRDFLLKITKEAGMEEYVDFRFEGATEAELREAQRASDVFVFPNVINIWGMAALEAMAAGLPLVVSRITSVAEVLSEGENALFSEPGNPEDIAGQIEKLLSNPALAERIAKNGQLFVKNNLTWKEYAKKFIALAEAKD
jgi:glycosyltransferase involved in cell wall biosynthesis